MTGTSGPSADRDRPPARAAALVLTTSDGRVLGALPALPVATPWWQDVGPVVDAFRQRYGFEAVILRLLDAERAAPPGGQVTYLAEVDQPVAAEPWDGALVDHPLRQSYARPGGPAADLAWARTQLTELDVHLPADPTQIRTWNLSSLWRLPCAGAAVWLKVVPPFFAHEGAILAHLTGGGLAPTLLARDGGRMLLAEAPGEDLYSAAPDHLPRMIERLVDLQRRYIGRTEQLLALGLPDWRGPSICQRVSLLADRLADQLPKDQRPRLATFVDRLPRRMAALAECGPGESLMHGDFHPGNFRGDGHTLTLLDWGDSGVGHPLFDQSAFLGALGVRDRSLARRRWRRAWREAAPAMDFARAERLIAPVAAARRAAVYQGFLDAIEPSEHPYHAADPTFWLRAALELAGRDDP